MNALRKTGKLLLAILGLVIATHIFDHLPPAEKIVVAILMGCGAIALAIIDNTNRTSPRRIDVAEIRILTLHIRHDDESAGA